MNVPSVEYGIGVNRLLAAMHDRASANGVAMTTIKVLYLNLLDVQCYSHTIDHVGERFKTPTLDEFIRLWISLFAHSPRTLFEWKEVIVKSMDHLAILGGGVGGRCAISCFGSLETYFPSFNLI